MGHPEVVVPITALLTKELTLKSSFRYGVCFGCTRLCRVAYTHNSPVIIVLQSLSPPRRRWICGLLSLIGMPLKLERDFTPRLNTAQLQI